MSALHARLKTVEPRRMRAQTALIAALNNRTVDRFRTVARAASARDQRAASAWIQFDTAAGAVTIAPLLVDNQLARMTDGHGRPDGAASAATLGQIEPLVAAAETILQLQLQPVGLVTEPAGDPLLIRLDALEPNGAMRHRLLIGTPAEIEVEPLPLPADLPAVLTGLKLRWTARSPLPPLPQARLGMLGVGDVVLMGTGPLKAAVTLPGRNRPVAVSLDTKRGIATLDREPQEGDANVSNGSMREDDRNEPSTTTLDWKDIRIASTIEFDGSGLTAAELATLGEGSVLPLPVDAGSLAVRVVAGGNVVADGELVALGEGFGVMITGLRGQQPA